MLAWLDKAELAGVEPSDRFNLERVRDEVREGLVHVVHLDDELSLVDRLVAIFLADLGQDADLF